MRTGVSRPAQRYAGRLTALATGNQPFGLSEPAMQGFVRVVTNPRIFDPPSPPAQAFRFLNANMGRPHCVALRRGPKPWAFSRGFCKQGKLKEKIGAAPAPAALAI